MNYLRKATASQVRAIGPFIDDTDFKTTKTSLTIANTDIKLVIDGAASANKNSGGGTHRVNGVYGLTFDATDTANVGEMEVSVVVSGALPVFKTFRIIEAAVYDALIAASAPGFLQPTTAGRTLDVTSTGEAGLDFSNVNDGTTGAVPVLGIVDQGTAQSASSTGIVGRSAAAFADSSLVGCILGVFGSTQGYWQFRMITANLLSGDAYTVDAWTVTPSGTITYKIFGGAPASATLLPAVDVEQWKGSTAPAMTGDAFARLGAPAGASHAADVAAVKTDTAAVKVQTDKLVFTVSNQVDCNVLDWKSSTAPAMTGDAFARLGAPAGASVSADIAAAKVDTAAIKVQTDKLVFSVANQVDVNVIDWKGSAAPAMTGDAFARLGAPAGASVSADVAAVKTDTAAVKTQTDKLTFTNLSSVNYLKSDFRLVEGAATIDGLSLTKTLQAGPVIVFGKSSGIVSGVGTLVFRNVSDTGNFASVTVDSDGNRTSATIN